MSGLSSKQRRAIQEGFMNRPGQKFLGEVWDAITGAAGSVADFYSEGIDRVLSLLGAKKEEEGVAREGGIREHVEKFYDMPVYATEAKKLEAEEKKKEAERALLGRSKEYDELVAKKPEKLTAEERRRLSELKHMLQRGLK